MKTAEVFPSLVNSIEREANRIFITVFEFLFHALIISRVRLRVVKIHRSNIDALDVRQHVKRMSEDIVHRRRIYSYAQTFKTFHKIYAF